MAYLSIVHKWWKKRKPRNHIHFILIETRYEIFNRMIIMYVCVCVLHVQLSHPNRKFSPIISSKWKLQMSFKLILIVVSCTFIYRKANERQIQEFSYLNFAISFITASFGWLCVCMCVPDGNNISRPIDAGRGYVKYDGNDNFY